VRRLIQFHPSVTERDAIGNEMVALHRAVSGAGIESRLYALEGGAVDGVTVRSVAKLDVTACDTLLLHYSLGHEAFESLARARCRRLLLFHDVTPPELLRGAPLDTVEAARAGLARAGWVASQCEAAAVHSRSSASSLKSRGGPGATVLPYLLRPELLETAPDPAFAARLGGRSPILLTVGRVLPHKRIEDVILVYDYLRRVSPDPWHLVVAGSTDHAPGYVESLASLCGKLELPGVRFTGGVSQAELNGWFRAARSFLCMSAHEGFCVPLVEAMHHRLPVFALSRAAIPETLRGAGVTFSSPDWVAIAEAIDAVERAPGLRNGILDVQDQAYRTYEPGAAARTWLEWLELPERESTPTRM